MRRLLNEGMDVNAPAWGPKSPGATPLHLAAQGGHVKVMDELLERGANIDARTKGACGCKFTLFFSKLSDTTVFTSCIVWLLLAINLLVHISDLMAELRKYFHPNII